MAPARVRWKSVPERTTPASARDRPELGQIVFHRAGSESVRGTKQRGYTGPVLVGTFPIQPVAGQPRFGRPVVARPARMTDRSGVGE